MQVAPTGSNQGSGTRGNLRNVRRKDYAEPKQTCSDSAADLGVRVEGDEAGSASAGKTAKCVQLLPQEGSVVTTDLKG